MEAAVLPLFAFVQKKKEKYDFASNWFESDQIKLE